ncbi:MAG: cation transporter [Acidimicrobiales bacterium]|nr:cation transporter [Acidimicrobiales bacterium]
MSQAKRAIVLERVTIGYNVIEGLVAVTFGIIAGSVALTGFGFDSWIEVTAAAVVLRRLHAEVAGGEPDEAKDRRALRIVAVTFFVLATYVTVEGVRDLVMGDEPSISVVGIVLTALSAVIMPALARLKRAAGEAMNSRLVLADAAETKLCAWLSVSTLAGLAGFAAFGLSWIDPLAGFVIAYFAVREGREAWEGELVCDDED